MKIMQIKDVFALGPGQFVLTGPYLLNRAGERSEILKSFNQELFLEVEGAEALRPRFRFKVKDVALSVSADGRVQISLAISKEGISQEALLGNFVSADL